MCVASFLFKLIISMCMRAIKSEILWDKPEVFSSPVASTLDLVTIYHPSLKSSACTTWSSQAMLLWVARKTSRRNRAFLVVVPSLWNGLWVEFSLPLSLPDIKRKLKTKLFWKTFKDILFRCLLYLCHCLTIVWVCLVCLDVLFSSLISLIFCFICCVVFCCVTLLCILLM